MFNILYSLLAFLVAMMLLVTVHEFGHFWVARLLGVKVLRFSIGFGKPLLSWRGKSNTEYVLAAVPIGGYVKMLDEREGIVTHEQLPYAFNRQPVLKRIAIVAAGPFFNILFAIFAYWLMFVIGITSLAPIIGTVKSNSIAAVANLHEGEEIIAIGDKKIRNWQDVNLALMPYVGSKNSLIITVIDPKTSYTLHRSLDMSNWHVDEQKPKPLDSLGITPYMPLIPPHIDEVTAGEAADKAGMKAGDRVIKINNGAINDWRRFAADIKTHPQKPLDITVLRNNKPVNLRLIPASQITESGEHTGFIGVKVRPITFPPNLLRKQQYNPWQAIVPALNETVSMMVLSVVMLWKLVVGDVSLHSISGPVGIAMGAGVSASLGIISYLSFLAIISISLAVLNFLPVPILDGGYLLNFLIEIIRGKPVSEKTEAVGLKIGLFILISLMVIAFYNDITRFVG